MVQEMAKQHLNFETQLNKRSKRNGLSRGKNNLKKISSYITKHIILSLKYDY